MSSGCRTQVAAQLASYRKVLAAKPAGIDAFEREFFNHMILALDHYFMHRLRNMEGKDGNPLNEVRMLCNAIMGEQGTHEHGQDHSLQAGDIDPQIGDRRRVRV